MNQKVNRTIIQIKTADYLDYSNDPKIDHNN